MQRIQIDRRDGWRSARAADDGGDGEDDEPFWNDAACYRFSREQIEAGIAGPCAEIESMCFEIVARVVESDAIMEQLSIPEDFRDYIRSSWLNQEKNLYGRMDLSYDGSGPAKFLEYNADTPTMLVESGRMQATWLRESMEQGIIPPDCDQFNLVDAHLIDAFRAFGIAGALHLTCDMASSDDEATIRYLSGLAETAGLGTVCLDLEDIGLDEAGRFTDFDDNVITTLFKLYPWEFMMRDDFADAIPGSGTTFIEPAWRAILSSKGLLPLLWETFDGHPNLLPAYFSDDPKAGYLANRYVRKPLWSRQGENIEIVRPETGRLVTDGHYGDEGRIVQALQELPVFDGCHAVTSCWVVASQASGVCVREGSSPVTTDDACFVPHVVRD